MFLGQGWRTFLRALAQKDYKFRRNSSSCPLWNFEEKNKDFEHSVIIINYCIIIINAY
jgi:hypothetical protein